MKFGLKRPITAAALLCSLVLTACSGSQNGLLPNASLNQNRPRHADGVISHESPENGANDGICGTSGVGLDCANDPSVAEPGPLPNESACEPWAGDTCVAVKPRYRSPAERSCNDKGGVFITKPDGTTVCSSDQLLKAFIAYDVGCDYVITTYPSLGGGTGIQIIPKPRLIPRLPSSYDSVWGVQINADCGWNILFKNPVQG